MDLFGERKIEEFVVFDDFDRNRDRIGRVRKALIQDVEGFGVSALFDVNRGEFDVGFGVFRVDANGFF